MAETSKEPSGARKAFGDFAPAFVGFTDDVLFGQVWTRPEAVAEGAQPAPGPDAMATLDAASDPDPAPYPYRAFDSSQRDRTANGPEVLGQLVQAHAKGDHLGVHPAR